MFVSLYMAKGIRIYIGECKQARDSYLRLSALHVYRPSEYCVYAFSPLKYKQLPKAWIQFIGNDVLVDTASLHAFDEFKGIS